VLKLESLTIKHFTSEVCSVVPQLVVMGGFNLALNTAHRLPLFPKICQRFPGLRFKIDILQFLWWVDRSEMKLPGFPMPILPESDSDPGRWEPLQA